MAADSVLETLLKALADGEKEDGSNFVLQFDPALILELAVRYDYEDDTEALNAGKSIASGNYSRANLEVIFRWKTGGRGISRLSRNTDAEIADALRLAIAACTERSAIAVLCGLNGVGIPVASAIMTVVDPQRFTIIDFRALEALGFSAPPVTTIDFYLVYLRKCRELADQFKVALRTLDRAMWQWSKERSQGSDDLSTSV